MAAAAFRQVVVGQNFKPADIAPPGRNLRDMGRAQADADAVNFPFQYWIGPRRRRRKARAPGPRADYFAGLVATTVPPAIFAQVPSGT